jgi:uncharacterized protein (DUF924 family)
MTVMRGLRACSRISSVIADSGLAVVDEDDVVRRRGRFPERSSTQARVSSAPR